MPDPILIAMTGASGAIYGIETLRLLKAIGRPAHLILSEVARRTIEIETDGSVDEVKALADVVHSTAIRRHASPADLTAPPAC